MNLLVRPELWKIHFAGKRPWGNICTRKIKISWRKLKSLGNQKVNRYLQCIYIDKNSIFFSFHSGLMKY